MCRLRSRHLSARVAAYFVVLARIAASAMGDPLVAVEEVWCDSSVTQVESKVILHLKGPKVPSLLAAAASSATSSVTYGEDMDKGRLLIAVLEEIVKDTYNSYYFVGCDRPHFRVVHSVKAEVGMNFQDDTSFASAMERTSASASGDNETNAFDDATTPLVLTIQAECRNCTNHFPLFSTPTPNHAMDVEANSSSRRPETQDAQPAPDFGAYSSGSNHIAEGTSSISSSTSSEDYKKYRNKHPGGLRSLMEASSASTSRGFVQALRNNPKDARPSHTSLRSLQQDDTYYCVCPLGAHAHPLSVELFLSLLNPKLARLLEPEDVTVTADQVEELQAGPCGSFSRDFNSFVLLDFDLDRQPSVQEIQALEEAFRTVYNRLTFETCDPYFRTITSATLDLKVRTSTTSSQAGTASASSTANRTVDVAANSSDPEMLLARQSKAASNVTQNSTTYADLNINVNGTDDAVKRTTGKAVFTIQGNCRLCPVSSSGSFTLFDDAMGAFRRRMEATDESTFDAFTHADERRRRNLAQALDLVQLNSPANMTTSSNNTGNTSSTCFCGAETPSNVTANATNNTSATGSATFVSYSLKSFLEGFTEEVQELKQVGRIETVQSVGDLIEEGQQVQCGNNIQSFRSEVFSDLRVNKTSLVSRGCS